MEDMKSCRISRYTVVQKVQYRDTENKRENQGIEIRDIFKILEVEQDQRQIKRTTFIFNI